MRLSLKTILDRVVPVAFGLWIAVELYSAFFGATSFRALRLKEAEAAGVRAEIAMLRDAREAMARRADNLNSTRLDLELLDERARAVLGYAAEDEIIIPRDQYERALRDSAIRAEASPAAAFGGR